MTLNKHHVYVTQRQRHAITTLRRALLECVEAGYDVLLPSGALTLREGVAPRGSLESRVPNVVVRPRSYTGPTEVAFIARARARETSVE